MSHVDRAIERIQAATEKVGVAPLAKAAGVKYTTVVDWNRAGFRTKAFEALNKLERAAEAIVSDEAA